MLSRIAALSGLLAPVTYTAALLFGGLAQTDGFSSADDAISDLGRVAPHLQHQLVRVAGLADHVEAGLLEDPSHALPQKDGVVGEHHAHEPESRCPRGR